LSRPVRRRVSARAHGRISFLAADARAALAGVFLGLALVVLPTQAAGQGSEDVATSVAPADPAASAAPDAPTTQSPGRPSFGPVVPSMAARQVAERVMASGDNAGLPFAIVDKAGAVVLVFDKDGTLRGQAPALLGLASGDDSVPGIGQRKLSTIRPEERTTPAGRFVVSLGENLQGQEILWIDYEAAISLHRVVAGTARERRAQRLASDRPQDRRISYGCINVPVAFYDSVVSPTFSGTSGIVYVLPETRPVASLFAH
jgi:hypothetical protein